MFRPIHIYKRITVYKPAFFIDRVTDSIKNALLLKALKPILLRGVRKTLKEFLRGMAEYTNG